MMRILILLTLFFIVSAEILEAQRVLMKTAPDTVAVYGYAASSFAYSDSLTSTPVEYFTIGLSAGWNKYSFIGEYDPFNQRVNSIQARISFDLFKGRTTIIPGRSLSPSAYQYSGPKSLRLPTWGKSLNNFTIYGDGVALWYVVGDFAIRSAYYSEPDKFNAGISYKWVSAYYESSVGFGGIITPPVKSRWINLKVGISYYESGILETGTTAIFLNNYLQVNEATRLYSQIDFGAVDQRIMTGASIELRSYWYLNLYWQNEQEQNTLFVHLKYSFN
jgi:hypothetical protein